MCEDRSGTIFRGIRTHAVFIFAAVLRQGASLRATWLVRSDLFLGLNLTLTRVMIYDSNYYPKLWPVGTCRYGMG